jgi:AraC-like DNA-binding protein
LVILENIDPHKNRFVVILLAYAVQRGLSPEQLCRLSNLDFNAIKNGSPIRITKKNLNDLWVNVVHISKDRLFGLHFAESLQLAAIGVIGQIIQSSNTIGQALTIGISHAGLVYDDFSMKITHSKKSFTVHLILSPESRKDPVPSFQQMSDFLLVFLLHVLDCLLLTRIKPIAERLSKLKLNEKLDPQVCGEYERIFRCKPKMTETNCSVEMPLKYWNEPIITANHELQNILIQKSAGGSALNWNFSQTIKERVFKYLSDNSYLDILTLEKVASNLNMSPRTLQRKLNIEGYSFQELADEARKNLAMHYIKLGHHLKEISRLLGYTEISAFSRAFKRWTGKNPGRHK